MKINQLPDNRQKTRVHLLDAHQASVSERASQNMLWPFQQINNMFSAWLLCTEQGLKKCHPIIQGKYISRRPSNVSFSLAQCERDQASCWPAKSQKEQNMSQSYLSKGHTCTGIDFCFLSPVSWKKCWVLNALITLAFWCCLSCDKFLF